MSEEKTPVVRCCACHKPLQLRPPIGMTAGLCPDMECLKPGNVKPEYVGDYARMIRMVATGRMRFEYEEGLRMVWFAQVPLKPPGLPSPPRCANGPPILQEWRPLRSRSSPFR